MIRKDMKAQLEALKDFYDKLKLSENDEQLKRIAEAHTKRVTEASERTTERKPNRSEHDLPL